MSDTFAEEESELMRAIAGREPRAEGIASMLARTCEDQRRLLQSQHDELTRARAALATADCPQTTAEEVGDAICRLAGERDQLAAMIDEMGKALGLDMARPDARAQVARTVLHIAARQTAVARRPGWPSWPALVGRILP